MADSSIKLEDYEFDLPEELIAQDPPEARGGERSDARLAVVARGTNRVEHRIFRDLVEYFDPSDVLVVNNARVVPTLLSGEDEEGRVIALSIHSPMGEGIWRCLAAPAAVCRPGATLRLGPQRQITGRLLIQFEPGAWQIALEPGDGETLYRTAEPIYPGYLKKAPVDPEFYQTTYGSRPGAVLFPSAGRHFTPRIIEELQGRGVGLAELTLLLAPRSLHFVRSLFRRRVAQGGVGDVEAEEDLDLATQVGGVDFPRAERYEVTSEAAELINERRSAGGRIFACGTSAVRTLESVADGNGRIEARQGFTDLHIKPGHTFRACDAFLTNLHRPKSSELLLTAAFTGREPLLDIYRRELIPRKYFFHEFGDSMLIR